MQNKLGCEESRQYLKVESKKGKS